MEKILKSGRKIEMRELTALEEILAYHILGEEFDPDKLVASVMLQRSTAAALTIEKLDDENIVTPASLPDVYKILQKFKKREWDEVIDFFDEINGAEDELGE